MADENTATIDQAEDEAAFGAGFEGKPAPKAKTPEKPEARAEAPRTDGEPEFVQVTRKEWEEIRAVAAKTASYDAQLSRLFGTTGNLQKLLNEQAAANKATPAETPKQGKKVEISREAFAAMEKDFPELAQQTRAALEAALSGISLGGDAEVDAGKIEQMLATLTSKREIEALEDAYPEWRKIVGAVDTTKEQPDPENPFRKWLANKDAAYQARVNGTESAAVIGRAIRMFQNETKVATAKPATPARDERAERIRAAVQPKGDGAPAASAKSDDDEFIAGFNSR